MDRTKRYTDYNSYLRARFGERVQKIAVDAGLTCPNRDGHLSDKGCIYCNAKGSGTGAFARGMGIRAQIEAGKIPMMKKYKAKKFLAYFQSFTNTYTSLENMRRMYDAAFSCEGVVGMAVGTRPDCIDRQKLDLIESYARKYLVWLEYGLQSVHDTTLAFINRGHGLKEFQRAVAMTRGRGIQICAHVILGLPGETREMMLDTARYLAESGIQGVKIHLLYVIRDTPLDQLFLAGKYRPMEQSDYVETVCDFLEHLPEHMVIQRITGDPHGSELRAPAWAGRYRETFNRIQQALLTRNSFQGKKYRRKNQCG